MRLVFQLGWVAGMATVTVLNFIVLVRLERFRTDADAMRRFRRRGLPVAIAAGVVVLVSTAGYVLSDG